jgi:hypothetical protein
VGSERCTSKNAVLGCNKKSGKSGCSTPKRRSGGKPPQIRPPPKQNRSESQCSCIFQEPMNRGKYAYMGLWVKYAFRKSSCFSKVTPVVQKNRRITVSVFLSTLQSTALLLKKIRLRFHCYTLLDGRYINHRKSTRNLGNSLWKLQLWPTELKAQSVLQIEFNLILSAVSTGLLAQLTTVITVM